jgi:acid phosphatase
MVRRWFAIFVGLVLHLHQVSHTPNRKGSPMSRKLVLLACLHIILAGCGSVTVTQRPPHDAVSPPFIAPRNVKVVIVMLENKDGEMVHDPKYSFLADLASQGADFTRYYGLAHPSQPNYVALVSGSLDGIAGDRNSTVSRPHIGNRLTAKGLTWKCYAEDYPKGTCDLSETRGRYARKHVPFLSFADIQNDAESCRTHITNFDEFLSDARAHRLPDYSMVIPNLDNDAHDPVLQPNRALGTADAWLDQQFKSLMADPEFKRDVVLIVTFDEDDVFPVADSDNRIYTVIWGDHVIPGKVDRVYDHYDLLRTIEEIFHLEPMAEGDRNAVAISGIWR